MAVRVWNLEESVYWGSIIVIVAGGPAWFFIREWKGACSSQKDGWYRRNDITGIDATEDWLPARADSDSQKSEGNQWGTFLRKCGAYITNFDGGDTDKQIWIFNYKPYEGSAAEAWWTRQEDLFKSTVSMDDDEKSNADANEACR